MIVVTEIPLGGCLFDLSCFGTADQGPTDSYKYGILNRNKGINMSDNHIMPYVSLPSKTAVLNLSLNTL